MLLAHLMALKVPAQFDHALNLECIFFAALIGTFLFMPAIQQRYPAGQNPAAVPIVSWFFFSSIVAFVSSVGGGIIRRLIASEETILTQPLHEWWQPMFYGWLLAFVLCLFRSNPYARFFSIKVVLDKVDAWIMGAFAAAGAAASLKWQVLGDWSNVPFFQLAKAIVFAAITGAAGGLVAKIFSRLSFSYEGVRQLFKDIWNWAIADYTRIGILVGFASFCLWQAIGVILRPLAISVEEFVSRSVDVQTFVRNLGEGWLQSNSANSLLLTDKGLPLIIFILSGCAACYMFRSSN